MLALRRVRLLDRIVRRRCHLALLALLALRRWRLARRRSALTSGVGGAGAHHPRPLARSLALGLHGSSPTRRR